MIRSLSSKPPIVKLSTHAIFSDFDGTLVDIADKPESIAPPPTLPTILHTLLDCSQGSVAVVTGRQIDNINNHLKVPKLFISGCHGMEWSTPGETDPFVCDAPHPLPEAVVNGALTFAEQHGMLTENKKHTLALHYRNDPGLETSLDQFLSQLIEPHSDLTVMRGKCIREVKPSQFNKAIAIKKFMSLPAFHNKTPVFIGDDVTDEYGFEYVNKYHGVSIKVGAGDSVANYRLESPTEVLNYLEQLIKEHRKYDVA